MGERAVDDSSTTRDRRGRTLLAVVTSLVGIAYVVWRAGWTLTGVPAGLAISALVVEAVGVTGTVLLLGALRKPERVACGGRIRGCADLLVDVGGQSCHVVLIQRRPNRVSLPMNLHRDHAAVVVHRSGAPSAGIRD